MCRSAPERTELLPIILKNVPPFCHSDRSASGVEESTTLENEPTQDKTSNLGRFLDSLRSLGMTCRYVVPFNHTGCIRNVAGGRLPKKSWCDCHRQSIDFDSLRGAPPLRTHWWVIPFIYTGDICHAPGTAHRPFPTVSLGGGTIQPHRLYSQRGGRQDCRPYIL